MKRQDYKKMFDKYIRLIILPKFPDILGFNSSISHTKDWFYNAKPVYTYKPYFVINDQEMSNKRRDEIYDVMKTMEQAFQLRDKVRIQYGLKSHNSQKSYSENV